MQKIIELERRIAAALERIGAGVDLALRPAAPGAAPAEVVAELEAALVQERAATAALRAELAAVRDQDVMAAGMQEERIDYLNHQLDVQGLELQRMRRSAMTLREELRQLREAQAAGVVDPAQINRALLAEIDALRASRLTELAELDELTATLDHHLTEAENA